MYNLEEFKVWAEQRIGEQAFPERDAVFATIGNLGGLENFLNSSFYPKARSLIGRWMTEVDERERERERERAKWKEPNKHANL